MVSSENKNWFTPLFIITILLIAFGVLYYVFSDFYEQRFPDGRQEFDYAGRPVQSIPTTDQILLSKNEKVVVGRTCLVFKGVDKKMIIVDLYLLDMDSEQAYEKRFLKKDAKKEMLLGGGRFRLISVNDRHLNLKELHKPLTP